MKQQSRSREELKNNLMELSTHKKKPINNRGGVAGLYKGRTHPCNLPLINIIIRGIN